MTKHQPDAELKSYFREARTWGEDRQESNARSRRIAWIVAGVAATVAALEAIALAGLTPLKTVVPQMVLVDRQTGHVTTIDPSQPVRLSADAALTKSMLAQYVTARESMDRSTIGTDYRKVMLWSGETARASYLALMKPGNPANPLAQIPNQQAVQAQIKSVSLTDNGQAFVRYDLIQRTETGNLAGPSPHISVIRYRFRDRPLVESDRFINPLGFEVLRYRSDPEAVPAGTGEGDVAQSPIAGSTTSLQAPSTGAQARP